MLKGFSCQYGIQILEENKWIEVGVTFESWASKIDGLIGKRRFNIQIRNFFLFENWPIRILFEKHCNILKVEIIPLFLLDV